MSAWKIKTWKDVKFESEVTAFVSETCEPVKYLERLSPCIAAVCNCVFNIACVLHALIYHI